MKAPLVSDLITLRLQEHYVRAFAQFGATPKGVDWGSKEDVRLRYEKMLAVIDHRGKNKGSAVTLLDVGCGYGGLYLYAKEKGIASPSPPCSPITVIWQGAKV